MSNPLIPQQRADKNGKITTRHVKSGPVSTASLSSLPAPSATPTRKPAKQKAVKPLARQLANQQRMIDRTELKSSPELRKALGIKDDAWRLAVIDATEVQLFDVFSVVEPENAINLFEAEIRTSEEALEFLSKNGLDDLVIDRREMMQKAVALRVDSFNLLELHRDFGGIGKYDEDVFLGAARVKGTNMLPYVSTEPTDQYPGTFYEGILRGEINYEDLAELTYSTLSMHSGLVKEAYDGLRAIKDGSAEYDATFLKRIISASGQDRNVLDDAKAMVSEYGEDFVFGLGDVLAAHKLRVKFGERGSDYCRKLIEFSEAYKENEYNSPQPDMVQKLCDAGIEPLDAKHLRSSGMSVDQIIGARKDGITNAVTGGWL